MKFRFTGDTDAPDWLLAEIATLSRISSVRMKLIAKQVLLKMVTGSMDYEKVLRLLTPKGAARASVSDTKGSIAALHFVVENAAKFGVDETTLHQELQQLGLPKENCDALSRQYRDNRAALRAKLVGAAYKHSTLLELDWRVDHVLRSSSSGEVNRPCVHLNFLVDTAPHRGELASREPDGERVRETTCEMPADKFDVLVYELRQAQALMASIDDDGSGGKPPQ